MITYYDCYPDKHSTISRISSKHTYLKSSMAQRLTIRKSAQQNLGAQLLSLKMTESTYSNLSGQGLRRSARNLPARPIPEEHYQL